MIPASLIVLHGGHDVEITLLDYLSRVLFYLITCGGVAVLAFWWMDAVEAVRSTLARRRGDATDG